MPDMNQLHVVAGVIRDPLGRILLARRTEGRDLAGLWEFPGGKLEPGESPQVALARELHEELGIRATVGANVIRVPQQYPDKRLVLDVHEVRSYTGTPKGLDGQALAWVPPQLLASYAMPPADRPVVAALLQPDRYLITPRPSADDATWLAALERALAAGIQRVQLRAPECEPERWLRLAASAVGLCREAHAEVLINGDVGMAARLGCGVHLRSMQLHELEGESLFDQHRKAGQLLAASCHTARDLIRAQALACDFVVLGPVRATATHPGAIGIGWEAFAHMREQVSLPIYALGGLTMDDLEIARTHGAQGVAAIRGLAIQAPT
ncbi:MAG: Nudix family hydrolase [Thermomonas sp.]